MNSGEVRSGFSTLLYKELLRFSKVGFQTIAAPVLTALLYLLIFGHVLEDHVEVFKGVGYTSFLVPGLVMMSSRRSPAMSCSCCCRRCPIWSFTAHTCWRR